MPLPIAAPLKTRLAEQLEAELKKATVFANFKIASWSLLGLSAIKSLPDKGDIADQLSRYIGDDAFATFVIDELDSRFSGRDADIALSERPLTEYEGFEDLKRLSTDLVEAFATLPWSYQLTIKLPNPLGNAVVAATGDFDLSPRHRIVSGATLSRSFELERRRRGGLADLITNGRLAPPWDEGGAYFQVAMSGYYRSKETEPFLSARDDVLTFFGLGIALGLLSDMRTDFSGGNSSHFYIHHFDDGKWREQRTLVLDDKHDQVINQLSLRYSIRDNPEAIRQQLGRIGSVFRSNLGQSLALSARWLFESYCGRDALLQYVQAAVAIEILLGDEETDPSVGLTTLMANRCAFLIAKTPTERGKLLKTFRNIYRVRSKIVHRGKSRLNAEEVGLFRELRQILRMVIEQEQRLLERAEDSTHGGELANADFDPK